MDFVPREAIQLLVNTAQREAFPHEREVRLCQFQTWVYFPERSPDWVSMAGSLMAVKYLNNLERGLLRARKSRTRPTSEVRWLLRDKDYAQLFDECVAYQGGWTEFVLMLEEMFDFERVLREQIQRAETVCTMIDYRFRYLDHGGTDRRQANISHSEFFRWKSDPKLSWKKIRERWSRNRQTAVFLYVSEGLGLRLSPSFDGVGFYSSDISKDVANRRHILRFFGTCAYIREKLRGEDEYDSVDEIEIPETVQRIRPQTNPLSDSDFQKMTSYRSERDKMRTR
jgi:hypothetical protein